jgi:zinc/manganese transport system permease protein
MPVAQIAQAVLPDAAEPLACNGCLCRSGSAAISSATTRMSGENRRNICNVKSYNVSTDPRFIFREAARHVKGVRPVTLQLIALLSPALLAGVVLTGIHAYLGVRIVERSAIFPALVIVQAAALGTAAADLAGKDLHSIEAWFWSLGFSMAGGAIIAATRSAKRIPRDAILGIVYAVATAATIVVLSEAPEGTEHLRDILDGNILTVSKHTVLATAILYGMVALLLAIFRDSVFVLYVAVGIVVTSSVAMAGVVLAFSYLLVPPVAAMLFVSSTGRRVAIGWITGALVSAAGILISFQADLPTGATIVCLLGCVLLLMAVIRRVVRLARG